MGGKHIAGNICTISSNFQYVLCFIILSVIPDDSFLFSLFLLPAERAPFLVWTVKSLPVASPWVATRVGEQTGREPVSNPVGKPPKATPLRWFGSGSSILPVVTKCETKCSSSKIAVNYLLQIAGKNKKAKISSCNLQQDNYSDNFSPAICSIKNNRIDGLLQNVLKRSF